MYVHFRISYFYLIFFFCVILRVIYFNMTSNLSITAQGAGPLGTGSLGIVSLSPAHSKFFLNFKLKQFSDIRLEIYTEIEIFHSILMDQCNSIQFNSKGSISFTQVLFYVRLTSTWLIS